MLLWILFALLAAAVVLPLARPLFAPPAPPPDGTAADLAVYRDQLAEIERDQARNVLDAGEAEAARAEVGRRLLRSADAQCAAASAAAAPPLLARALSGFALIGVPAGAIALYLAVGTPGLPQSPHAARVAESPQQAGIEELVQRVEARLRAAPEDGQGWDVIAPVYLRQQRFQDAAQAFSRALRLLGESPKRLAGLAESLVLANNGIVSEEARLAYERLARLEPERPEPAFWLALAKEQDGKLAAARDDYAALLARAPADAPWRATVEERLSLVKGRLDGTVRGPTADDVKAASRLSAEDQARMIDQMVAGLADRLKADGRDLEGWQRLLRAYGVLGRKESAVSALADARRAFAGDARALATLEELAKSLGIGG